MLRKAKAELEAEAAADHARQRERKACCAEQHGKRPRPSRGPAPLKRGRHGTSMPEAEWTARSAPKPAKRSTPCAQDHRRADVWADQGYPWAGPFPATGNRKKTFGELNLIAITHNLLKLHRAGLNTA